MRRVVEIDAEAVRQHEFHTSHHIERPRRHTDPDPRLASRHGLQSTPPASKRVAPVSRSQTSPQRESPCLHATLQPPSIPVPEGVSHSPFGERQGPTS